MTSTHSSAAPVSPWTVLFATAAALFLLSTIVLVGLTHFWRESYLNLLNKHPEHPEHIEHHD